MFARKSTSLAREASDSFGSNVSKTLRSVVSVTREFRLSSYSPAQKKVLPPATRSTSSVTVPRVRRTAMSSSPKSSPTGPTTRTSSKNDAARPKWVAAPPSIRSREPNGVLTASKAKDPTTVTLIGGVKVHGRPVHAAPTGPAPADRVDGMRAIQVTEFGGPEVLRLVDIPAPEPGEGEVLVR